MTYTDKRKKKSRANLQVDKCYDTIIIKTIEKEDWVEMKEFSILGNH